MGEYCDQSMLKMSYAGGLLRAICSKSNAMQRDTVYYLQHFSQIEAL